jgi:signal transduction histidine kinase
VHVSAEECRVRGDRDLIYVAIELVLDNAVRELRERLIISPRIDVATITGDDGLELRIRDNALPVDASLRHDVFEEGVSTYFRSGKGSGYGLAIVRRTFERHGSRVSISENYADSGSRLPGVTFRAILPLAQGDEHQW